MDPNMYNGVSEVLKMRPEVGEVNGIILPKGTCEIWERIWKFQALPDDLLICSYPKAGTTWMQEIVDMIRHKGDTDKCRRAPTYIRIPFIEFVAVKPIPSGIELCEELAHPRIMKSHLPIQLVPPSFWEQNCKVIYVARNAKDTLVSYFYFQKINQRLPDPGTWDQYFESFQEGKVPWGSWYDHVKGWWDAREQRRILYIFYEDMKADPRREIQKVLQFLEVDMADDILEKIVQNTSFQTMKENPMANYRTLPPFVFYQNLSPFMRKGVVGDWKNHFTVAQNERFNEEYKRRMPLATLKFHTES